MAEAGASGDSEKRLTAAEKRIEAVADDAAAARHLASAGDRDLAELTGRVQANQQATESVGVQIAGLSARITDLDERLTGKITELDERLSGKITELDQRLTGKITELDQRLTGKITELDQRLTGKITELDQRLTGKITELDERLGRVEVKLDANTAAINHLSVQTGERFAQVEKGFAEIRGKLDQTAAGLELIVKLLTPGPGAGER